MNKDLIEIPRTWRNLLYKSTMRRNELAFKRASSLYKSLCYIVGDTCKNTPQNIVYTYTPHRKDTEKCLLKMKHILNVLEEEVLFKPHRWSRNKYKETLHFVADTLSYLIEDLEKELYE